MKDGYVTAADMCMEDLRRELAVKVRRRETIRAEGRIADAQVRELADEIARREAAGKR